MQEKYLYTPTEVVDFVKASVSKYYHIEDFTLEDYDYLWNADGILKPKALIKSYDRNTSKVVFNEFDLTENSTMPFDVTNPDIWKMIQDTEKIEIKYTIINVIPQESNPSWSCFKWEVI